MFSAVYIQLVLREKERKQLSYDLKYWPDFLKKKCQSSGRKRKERVKRLKRH